jgi:putative oxidoreductase
MRWLFGGSEVSPTSANMGLLVVRLFSGLALAFSHGINKIPPSERFVESVGALGFPVPAFFAWAAGVAEFFGGIFLAVGLLTRPSALLIAVTMSVAAFVRHASDPFSVMEKALLFLAVALAFLFIGSGRFGVDTFMRRHSSR